MCEHNWHYDLLFDEIEDTISLTRICLLCGQQEEVDICAALDECELDELYNYCVDKTKAKKLVNKQPLFNRFIPS